MALPPPIYIGETFAETMVVKSLTYKDNKRVCVAECQKCGNGDEFLVRSLKRMRACPFCKDLEMATPKYPIEDDQGRIVDLREYLIRENILGDPKEKIARWHSAQREPAPYKTRDWIIFGTSRKGKDDKVLDHIFDKYIAEVISDATVKFGIHEIYRKAIKDAMGKDGRKLLRAFMRRELALMRYEDLRGRRKDNDPNTDNDTTQTPEASLESFLTPVDPDDLD